MRHVRDVNGGTAPGGVPVGLTVSAERAAGHGKGTALNVDRAAVQAIAVRLVPGKRRPVNGNGAVFGIDGAAAGGVGRVAGEQTVPDHLQAYSLRIDSGTLSTAAVQEGTAVDRERLRRGQTAVAG